LAALILWIKLQHRYSALFCFGSRINKIIRELIKSRSDYINPIREVKDIKLYSLLLSLILVVGLLIILGFLRQKQIISYGTAQRIGVFGCVLAAFPESRSAGWFFAGVTTVLLSVTTYYLFWGGEQIEKLKQENLKQAGTKGQNKQNS